MEDAVAKHSLVPPTAPPRRTRSAAASLILRVLSADDDLIPARVGHHVVERYVVAIAHSDAAVRRRTQEDAVPPRNRTPAWPHRSVDVNSSAVEFFHVQLVWSEGIAAQCGLTPGSIRGVAVLG